MSATGAQVSRGARVAAHSVTSRIASRTPLTWARIALRIISSAMPAINGLVEVVLVVEDLERSVRFYRDLLGLEVISPPAATATFLRVGPQDAGLPQQIVLVPRPAEVAPATGRRLHHIGLQVAPEDFDAERNRLALAGYALRSGVHPFMPVDAFYLDDPDGNEVEIATWRGEA